MKNLRIINSPTAPKQQDVIWARQVEGGFALYFKDGRTWKPLKLIDSGNTTGISDDLVIDVTTKSTGTKAVGFGLTASTTYNGTTAQEIKAFVSALRPKLMQSSLLNEWSKSVCTVKFVPTGLAGGYAHTNLLIDFNPSSSPIEGTFQGLVTYDDDNDGSNPSITVENSTPAAMMNPNVISYYDELAQVIASLTPSVVAPLIDTNNIVSISSTSNTATDANILAIEEALQDNFWDVAGYLWTQQNAIVSDLFETGGPIHLSFHPNNGTNLNIFGNGYSFEATVSISSGKIGFEPHFPFTINTTSYDSREIVMAFGKLIANIPSDKVSAFATLIDTSEPIGT